MDACSSALIVYCVRVQCVRNAVNYRVRNSEEAGLQPKGIFYGVGVCVCVCVCARVSVVEDTVPHSTHPVRCFPYS